MFPDIDMNQIEKARMPIALASSYALPQAGTDELWRRRQPRVIAGWPLPQAPSHDVVDEILGDVVTLKANDEFTCALAAVITDTAQLDHLLSIISSPDVKAHAAWNPNLSVKERPALPFSSLSVPGTDEDAEVTRRFLSGDAESCVEALLDPSLQTAMVALLARVSSFVKASKPEMLERVIAEVFPEADMAAFDSTSEMDAVRNVWTIRQMRGAVLDQIAARDPKVHAEVGAAIAATGRMVDPYVVSVIEAAIQAGLVQDPSKIQLSAYSAARAALVCPEASPLREKVVAPVIQHKRKKPAEVSIIDMDQDMYLAGLELLGLADAAARIAVSAGNLTDEEFLKRLPDADADTIVDWAERRLGQQPREGQVAEVIDSLSNDRQKDVLAEVMRRPNPIELQPELALCLPNATLLELDERGSVFVGVTASRALGTDPRAWSLACELLVQGWEPTILELLRSVEALVLNP